MKLRKQTHNVQRRERITFDHDSPDSSCLYLPELPYLLARYFPSLIAGKAVARCTMMANNCVCVCVFAKMMFFHMNVKVIKFCQRNFNWNSIQMWFKEIGVNHRNLPGLIWVSLRTAFFISLLLLTSLLSGLNPS